MRASILLTTLIGVLIAFQAPAFDDGIEYTTLSKPGDTETGDKIEVLEVFMYGCPHCYHLEPDIESWLETKPENVEFRRMPAVFSPKVEPHARAFYAAGLMGVEDRFHLPLFRALHDKKRKIWDEDALVDFAEEQGIDGEEFRKSYNSFYVNMKVRRAAELGKRYKIDGVPSVIVNGKYRTSPTQTGSREKLIQVIDHLIAVEAANADTAAMPPEPAAGGS
jgi:thiol:disulfide interchange protein DsbA